MMKLKNLFLKKPASKWSIWLFWCFVSDVRHSIDKFAHDYEPRNNMQIVRKKVLILMF